MNDRLTQFLAAEQLTPTRFADSLGVQRSGVSHILSGRNKPGIDFLEKFIKRFPAVNIEWFITGKGKMYKEMNTPTLFPMSAETQVEALNPIVDVAEQLKKPDFAESIAVNPLEQTEKTIEKSTYFL